MKFRISSNRIGLAATLIAAISLAHTTEAQITYVDSTVQTNVSGSYNTTLNGTLVNFSGGGNATTSSGQGSLTDGLWHWRLRSTVNGGALWEGDGTTGIATPLLQTLSLAPGTYNLYGLFWNNGNNVRGSTGNWDASFRVGDTGGYTFFDVDNTIPTTPTGTEFANSVITRDGVNAQVLDIAPLGQFTISSGSMNIYILAPSSASTFDQRTWFDGLGYEAVPEPTSGILLGLGGLMLLFRRRKY